MAKTALELNRKDWQKYQLKEIVQHRWQQNQKQIESRIKKALVVARKAAWVLKNDFGATKVVIFGSLTEKGAFTIWSDIDIAVWGIPDNRFYAAVAAVTNLSQSFKIDIVAPEACKPTMQANIIAKGYEL